MCDCLNCSDITIPTGSTGATGPQGPAGANGTNGVDGVSVLHNDISNSATTGTTEEILKTYTLPADTLDTDGSYIKINARFNTTTSSATGSGKTVSIVFNGSNLSFNTFAFANIDTYEVEVLISRFSNTSGRTKFIITASNSSYFQVIGEVSSGYSTIGGLNFTTTGYTITANGNSDVIGDVRCESLIITKYTK